MGQHLEVKGLLALVAHAEHSLQAVLGQSNAVLQAEVVRPGLLHVLAQIGRRQAKVEAYRIVVALPVARLGRRLAQVFPVRNTCKTVLRKLRCSVVLGGRAKVLHMSINSGPRWWSVFSGGYAQGRRRGRHL